MNAWKWLALLGALAAQPSFPPSSPPSSPAHLLVVRGIIALHNFEYEDANEAFQQARTLDPAEALAYWGEAMTYNQTLWRNENVPAGRGAVARVGVTSQVRAGEAPDPSTPAPRARTRRSPPRRLTRGTCRRTSSCSSVSGATRLHPIAPRTRRPTIGSSGNSSVPRCAITTRSSGCSTSCCSSGATARRHPSSTI